MYKQPEALLYIYIAFSNSTLYGTSLPAITVLYGFRIKELLNIIADYLVDIGEEPDIPQLQLVYTIELLPSAKYQPVCIDAYDAIKLAAIQMKCNYN